MRLKEEYLKQIDTSCIGLLMHRTGKTQNTFLSWVRNNRGDLFAHLDYLHVLAEYFKVPVTDLTEEKELINN